MSSLIQRSFAGGEIAPALYARADIVKYTTGLRTCRNFFIMKHGGASNRPGTGFVGEVKDSTKTIKLVPFVFNADQTYVLEFGNLYMRVHRNGAQVTLSSQNITAVTNANPAVVTYAGADTYGNGDEVYISGVVGAMANYINGRNFKVAGLNAGANTFQLNYLDGTAVNSTGWGAYSSGGTIAEVYEITTPYVEADLPELNYDQSADVITLTHPNYAPRELSRTGHTSWTLSTITFEPSTARPTGCTGTAGAAGSNTYRYKITAINAESFEESLSGLNTTTRNITNITQANPAVVTSNGHGFANGDIVYIASVAGMTQVNGLEFEVANQTANTFELRGIDSTGYTAYSSGGTANRVSIVIASAAAPTSSAPNALSWSLVSGAVEYNVYKELNGVYGFIGVAGSSSFNDTGIEADTTDTPPAIRNPFNATSNYPSTSTYYQQRHLFGNTDNDPEKVWASRSANFKNMTVSSPLQDDDAVTFNLAGRQVNEVRHMIDLTELIVLTSGAEWIIKGDEAGILKPGEINPKAVSYNGSSTLPPLIVNNSALYVQARGSIIRDLLNDAIEGYKGDDLTIFSAHLFEGYTLSNWAYQQNPHSIVWVTRSDGKLIGLTYVRSHQLLAWHRHDFDGTVENVCVVPEGTEDSLYLCIKRTVNSKTVRYIERMKTRRVDENAIEDSVFADCSLSYDGWHTGSTTMTLSGGTDWTYTEELTLTASAGFFVSGDVGNAIFLVGSDGTEIRFTISSFTNTTVVKGRAHMTVPAGMRSVAISTWAKAVDEVTGMWHLEGKDVSVFGDGFVVASPNNEAYTVRTVTNGVVTLDKPYAVIHAGLPYISDIETLDIDAPQGETVSDKKKIINRVTLHVEKSRGIWVGPKPPTDDDDDPLEGLREAKVRSNEGYDEPVNLTTDKVEVNIRSEWNSNGRIFVRQVDPVPLSILAAVPAGLVPFRG